MKRHLATTLDDARHSRLRYMRGDNWRLGPSTVTLVADPLPPSDSSAAGVDKGASSRPTTGTGAPNVSATTARASRGDPKGGKGQSKDRAPPSGVRLSDGLVIGAVLAKQATRTFRPDVHLSGLTSFTDDDDYLAACLEAEDDIQRFLGDSSSHASPLTGSFEGSMGEPVLFGGEGDAQAEVEAEEDEEEITQGSVNSSQPPSVPATAATSHDDCEGCGMKGSALTGLDLSHTNVGAEGCEAIFLGLSKSRCASSQIRRICFNKVRLGADGAFAIASGLHSLGQVEHLELKGCFLSDAGRDMKGVLGLMQVVNDSTTPALLTLDLSENLLSESACWRGALALSRHSVLRVVDLSYNCAFSKEQDERIDILFADLPFRVEDDISVMLLGTVRRGDPLVLRRCEPKVQHLYTLARAWIQMYDRRQKCKPCDLRCLRQWSRLYPQEIRGAFMHKKRDDCALWWRSLMLAKKPLAGLTHTDGDYLQYLKDTETWAHRNSPKLVGCVCLGCQESSRALPLTSLYQLPVLPEHLPED